MSTEGKKTYSASDLKTMSLRENVLARPEMYWGNKHPDVNDAIDLIREQMAILRCSGITVSERGGWFFLASNDDWISSGVAVAGDIKKLCTRGTGFPEAGHNSLRFEFLIHTFSKQMLVWRGDSLAFHSGECNPEQIDFLENQYQGKYVIAFTGNVYEKIGQVS
jgi:hypothetical protein